MNSGRFQFNSIFILLALATRSMLYTFDYFIYVDGGIDRLGMTLPQAAGDASNDTIPNDIGRHTGPA